MSVTFDERGYLMPYGIRSMSLDEFKDFFVESFSPTSTRPVIFQRYLQFLKDFSEQVTDSFEQWVNGSFVTLKDNPNDIDFVTIIEHSIFEKKEQLIEERFRLNGAQKYYNLDAYTMRNYPDQHPQNAIFKGELAYWTYWFGQTKKNRAKIKFKKGFVSIHFKDFKLSYHGAQ